MLPRLAEASAEIGLPFEAVPLERLGAEADVIITITSGFAPILMRDQVKPGTHIAAMGTDTKGKQELDPALVATARVFTDEVAQAVSIGECQHAVAGGLLAAERITPLGAVVAGLSPGRTSAGEITLFDGTGIALQDLAVAAAAASIAAERKLGLQIDL
jgi:ornithine cyclodeaminase